MNDLEICKRIAEIEFNDLIDCYEHEFDGICIDKPMCGMVFREAYNPLTDDALCFQLMVKYKIQLKKVTNGDGWAASFNRLNHSICTLFNTSPNKAICLATFEANKI